MPVLVYILITCFLITSSSLIGVFSLAARKVLFEKILLSLVALSAGTLMGGAFIHLMPEALEKLASIKVFSLVLLSFSIFYFIEKILHWRHCHEETCDLHSFGYINLIGDGVHNFIDGLIIAATFLIDIKLGITTSIAIAFHEIPQEAGNFGVLVYAGFKKIKALILNFLVSSIVIVGGFIGYFLAFYVKEIIIYLLPIAAGGFIYISTSDLIPEIKKEMDIKKSLVYFSFFLVGIGIMYIAKYIS